MATKTSTVEQSSTSAAVRQPYTTGFVTLRDGMRIGYRRLGSGPGIVMLHGAMESAQSHMQLAGALADAFTVYLPDRRGRGLSGPYTAGYDVQDAVADMDALLTATGTQMVFGISAGADIWLQALLSLPSIRKAALYEPALFLERTEPEALVARFDREMARGKLPAALVTAMKGAQMGPPIFNALPRWLLGSLTNMAMKQEDKKPQGENLPMRALAPTLHYDFALVAEMSGNLERFRDVRADVLLLGGSKSPAYLKTALDVLEKTLPHVTRVTFPGLDHGGSGNSDRGGKPQVVAQALRRFFA